MKKLLYSMAILLTCIMLTGCQVENIIGTKPIIAIIFIVMIAGVFGILARYSNMLRDEISDSTEFDANALKQQVKSKWKQVNRTIPYSLTKVQFGIWTVLISSTYVYLSLCKGDCAEGSINKTALVLMGIVAGTAVAGTGMDKKEISDNRPRHQNTPSEGFFIDILSDDNGISLHRFQNFAWTLIAMIVYLYKVSEVKTGCQLPELSDTLLALTGISSATYLVLRSQENDPPAVNVDSSPAPVSANSLPVTVATPATNGATAVAPVS